MDIGLLFLLMINTIFVAAFGAALLGARWNRLPGWRRKASLPGHDR